MDASGSPRPDLIRSGGAAVARFVGRLRGRHLLVVDLIGMAVAGYAALAIRNDAVVAFEDLSPYLAILTLLITIRVAANIRLGLYSRDWRFASTPDFERVLAAVAAASIAAVAIFGVTNMLGVPWPSGLPRSFWPAEALLSLTALAGVRFAIRIAADWAPRGDPVAVRDRHATLFYGAGRIGVQMARAARRKPDAGVVPVGFLDDDLKLAGRIVANLRVFGGLESLDRAVAETGAQVVLITMPSAAGIAVRRVVDAAMARGLHVRTVPSMYDLLDGSLDAYRIRRVQVEDLLRRPTATEHAATVRELIAGRTVVVTGAGGSIGSELARQVYSIGPRRLVLVDRAESSLYLLQRELESKRTSGQERSELRVHLANVVNRAAMDRLIASEEPDLILHAAAYKHVPMMEDHPSDAVQVNIGGTLTLLDAAVAAGVQHFVLVSTDKAVRPSSVMGASKRVAEMLLAEAAQRTGRPYVAVRFGNVLGSSGSVIPIFQEQLEKSEPLTITHPDMTRFFMTIPEASWLILHAAAMGAHGDLFVLDMGDPVRIVDLARDLVRLAGRDPDSQPMKIVGLRPGEKLHEELFYDAERVEPTSVAKVLRAVAEPPPMGVRDDARRLLTLATGGSEDELRAALLDYARADGVPRPMPIPTPDSTVPDFGVDAGTPAIATPA